MAETFTGFTPRRRRPSARVPAESQAPPGPASARRLAETLGASHRSLSFRLGYCSRSMRGSLRRRTGDRTRRRRDSVRRRSESRRRSRGRARKARRNRSPDARRAEPRRFRSVDGRAHELQVVWTNSARALLTQRSLSCDRATRAAPFAPWRPPGVCEQSRYAEMDAGAPSADASSPRESSCSFRKTLVR
jgi:hypothetical protein